MNAPTHLTLSPWKSIMSVFTWYKRNYPVWLNESSWQNRERVIVFLVADLCDSSVFASLPASFYVCRVICSSPIYMGSNDIQVWEIGSSKWAVGVNVSVCGCLSLMSALLSTLDLALTYSAFTQLSLDSFLSWDKQWQIIDGFQQMFSILKMRTWLDKTS